MDMVFSDTGDLHGGFYDSNAGVDYHVPVRGGAASAPPAAGCACVRRDGAHSQGAASCPLAVSPRLLCLCSVPASARRRCPASARPLRTAHVSGKVGPIAKAAHSLRHAELQSIAACMPSQMSICL